MTRLVCMWGTGDTYLVCALAREFEKQHGTTVEIVTKGQHLVIPVMFDLEASAGDREIQIAETDKELQRSWPNDGETIYCHPSFVRTPARLDQLTLKTSVCQADMYRAILRISPWSPLAKPNKWPLLAEDERYRDAVLTIPWAKSWPNANPAFWDAVEAKLRARGERVGRSDPTWALGYLFGVASQAKWVIGAQCGVMSIIAENLTCKKTFAVTQLLDKVLHGLEYTFPYGDPEKFMGTSNHGWDVVLVPPHLVPPHPGWQGAVDAVVG
jgi:hypothetical protein